MLTSIWTTFDNFINTVLGVCQFVIIFGFLVSVAFMVVPAIYRSVTGKELELNFPAFMKVSVIKNTKNGKNRIVFMEKISDETLKKHNWDVVETSIPILTAISIVFADMDE